MPGITFRHFSLTEDPNRQAFSRSLFARYDRRPAPGPFAGAGSARSSKKSGHGNWKIRGQQFTKRSQPGTIPVVQSGTMAHFT